MEGFINFLVDNYLWFIIITVILLFSLIGYLVDMSKLPSTEKEPKEKVKKPKKEKKKKEKKGKKEDILEDNTPTIEEVMKQEQMEKQENVTPELQPNTNEGNKETPEVLKVEEPAAKASEEVISGPIDITPENNYDLPLIKEEDNSNPKS